MKWEELGPDYPGVHVQVARVGGRLRIVGIRVQDPDGVTHRRLRDVPVVKLEAMLNERRDAVATPGSVEVRAVLPPRQPELRIRKALFHNPRGRGYDPAFYERVAELYAACVGGGVNPAPSIAAANNVPVSSVHRWIREARARGALVPARVGGGAG